MKKTLIIPYFGKFPDYFPLWVNSCADNPDINWLIITDIDNDYPLPDNITVVKKSFNEMREEFQSNFDFKISLDNPYKLCDYKPMYGFLFREYLKDSDFWGYCDMDTIWGQISSFLTDDIFENYDKVLHLGHLCFVRNKKEINENFRNFDSYRIALSSAASYAVDEIPDWAGHPGFNTELKKNGFKIYSNYDNIADVEFRVKPFTVGGCSDCFAYRYRNGKLFSISKNGEKEIMYVHFQKRKLQVNVDKNCRDFIVIPNQITDDFSIMESENFWENISKNDDSYFDMKNFKKNKIKNDIIRLKDEPDKLSALKWWINIKLGKS